MRLNQKFVNLLQEVNELKRIDSLLEGISITGELNKSFVDNVRTLGITFSKKPSIQSLVELYFDQHNLITDEHLKNFISNLSKNGLMVSGLNLDILKGLKDVGFLRKRALDKLISK